jgi:hypothetical protein
MLAAVVVNDILICVANLGGRAEMSQDEWDNRGDRRTDIAPTPAPSSGIAWESTTPCYVKYVTEERYQKFSDKAKRWYKPYRCSACSPSSEGGV